MPPSFLGGLSTPPPFHGSPAPACPREGETLRGPVPGLASRAAEWTATRATGGWDGRAGRGARDDERGLTGVSSSIEQQSHNFQVAILGCNKQPAPIWVEWSLKLSFNINDIIYPATEK